MDEMKNGKRVEEEKTGRLFWVRRTADYYSTPEVRGIVSAAYDRENEYKALAVSNIYDRLLTESIPLGGRLKYKVKGECPIPVLAHICMCSERLMAETLNLLQEQKLLFIESDGAMYFPQIKDMLSLQSVEAKRKAAYRTKMKEGMSSAKLGHVPDMSPADREKDKDTEKVREGDCDIPPSAGSARTRMREIAESVKAVCPNLPDADILAATAKCEGVPTEFAEEFLSGLLETGGQFVYPSGKAVAVDGKSFARAVRTAWSVSRRNDRGAQGSPTAPSPRQGQAPTLAEVEEFFAVRRFNEFSSATEFFNYFAAKGWAGVADWKARACVWAERDGRESGKGAVGHFDPNTEPPAWKRSLCDSENDYKRRVRRARENYRDGYLPRREYEECMKSYFVPESEW